eukprot:6192937-Pleurochrysis_carterae.AAC.2
MSYDGVFVTLWSWMLPVPCLSPWVHLLVRDGSEAASRETWRQFSPNWWMFRGPIPRKKTAGTDRTLKKTASAFTSTQALLEIREEPPHISERSPSIMRGLGSRVVLASLFPSRSPQIFSTRIAPPNSCAHFHHG